jgi:hypothetical protein
MTTERERIEKMQTDGKITTEEAERLKAALMRSGSVAGAVATSEPDYAKKEYHKLAIASIALAAISLLLHELGLITALAGLILGFIAWHQTSKQRDRYKGRWLAILAVAVQGIPLFCFVAVVGLGIYPRLSRESQQDEGVFVVTEPDGAKVRLPMKAPKLPADSAAIQNHCARATLEFAKAAEAEIANYLKWKEQNPDKTWTTAAPAVLPALGSKEWQIENAVIYFGKCGATPDFVYVARIKEAPLGVSGQALTFSDPALGKVSCAYGWLPRNDQAVPGWRFLVRIDVPGHPDEIGQADLIIGPK